MLQSQDDRSSLEAAAEAAAKVNAMLISKGMLKPNQIHGGTNVITKKAGGPNSLVVAEVEINNLTTPCRNTLTRGTTQEEISKASGAAVTTRGRYMAPDERVRNPRDRCLFLNVQASTKESVDIAVQKVNEIIKSMCGSKNEHRGRGMGHHRGGRGMRHPYRPPALPNRNSLRSQAPPPLMSLPTPPHPPVQMPMANQPPPETVTIVQEKLYVGLEHAPPNFDTKNKLLGPEGSYLQHIQQETGAAVSLRGKGSGFLDMTVADNFEPMHVHIQHQSLVGLQEAKKLAENLIQTVQQSYVSFQQALAALPPSMPTGLITGVRQQPPYIEQQLMPPPVAPVPDHQLQALQPQIQTLGPPPMMLPAASVPSQMPPLHQAIQNTAPGPQMVIPSSLTLTQLPLINTLPVSAPSVLTHQPSPLEQQQQQQQQQMILSQQPPQPGLAPPPQLLQQRQPPMGPPPPAGPSPQQLHPGQLPPAGVYTSVQPTLQLVSQPVVSVVQPGQQPQLAVPPPPMAQSQPQPQALPLLMGPPPPAPQHPYPASTSVVYTVASSGVPYYTSPKLEEVPKRRFTEEKDDNISDNLLGYQHGPPHLVNLVRSSPPPNSQAAAPQQHVIQLAPQDQAQFAHLAGHPAMIQPGQPQPHQIHLQPQGPPPPPPHFHHPGPPQQASQLLSVPHNHLMGPPPVGAAPAQIQMSQAMDVRLQAPPSSSSALMPPPPPPSPLSSQAGIREEEMKAMMPPPKSPELPWDSKPRGPSPSPFEPDKKKIRGILKNKNQHTPRAEAREEVSESAGEAGTNNRQSPQEETSAGEGRENREEKQHQHHHHPASPQYQGQPLLYPSMPSDPNLPPTSTHEPAPPPGPAMMPPHQLRPLPPGHPHVVHQPEPGHVLAPHPHLHYEGPHPEAAPPGPQIVLEHPGLAPPPGMHLAQAPPHHRLELAGPPPPAQRQVILEQPDHVTPHLPPHPSQELFELEMQQQQQVQPPPPPQFHHIEHITVSQAGQEQIIPPGSAVIVSSGQPYPQYSVAISSAGAVVPPPPPPPQSYTLATSGVPLAIHSAPSQHILAGPPPPAPVSSYSLAGPPPPIPSSYSVGVPPPPPPTPSQQFQQQQHFTTVQLQPQPAHVFQPGQQQPQQQQQQAPQPLPPPPSSQYQPTPQTQPTISYWLPQVQ